MLLNNLDRGISQHSSILLMVFQFIYVMTLHSMDLNHLLERQRLHLAADAAHGCYSLAADNVTPGCWWCYSWLLIILSLDINLMVFRFIIVGGDYFLGVIETVYKGWVMYTYIICLTCLVFFTNKTKETF